MLLVHSIISDFDLANRQGFAGPLDQLAAGSSLRRRNPLTFTA